MLFKISGTLYGCTLWGNRESRRHRNFTQRIFYALGQEPLYFWRMYLVGESKCGNNQWTGYSALRFIFLNAFSARKRLIKWEEQISIIASGTKPLSVSATDHSTVASALQYRWHDQPLNRFEIFRYKLKCQLAPFSWMPRVMLNWCEHFCKPSTLPRGRIEH